MRDELKLKLIGLCCCLSEYSAVRDTTVTIAEIRELIALSVADDFTPLESKESEKELFLLLISILVTDSKGVVTASIKDRYSVIQKLTAPNIGASK